MLNNQGNFGKLPQYTKQNSMILNLVHYQSGLYLSESQVYYLYHHVYVKYKFNLLHYVHCDCHH